MTIRPLQIADVPLATNLLLAPIAGYCDVAFRLVARSLGGVGLACTDLLCPEGVIRETKRSLELAATCPEDSPLCMQLYGANVDKLCEAAMWAEDRGAHVIDINMGCPVDKVTKRDGGSKLLCHPDHTLKMVELIKGCLHRVPLTCKLRLGWDEHSIVAPYLARRLEDAGVAMVTIHGRTTEMRFAGQARLNGIAAVVGAVKHIPVVGNGDIRTPQDAARMLEYTKCAGVMIGRGALIKPWIFPRHVELPDHRPNPPRAHHRPEMPDDGQDHFDHLCRFRNEHIALMELRKRRGSTPHHDPLPKAARSDGRDAFPADFERVLTNFLAWRADYDAQVRHGLVPPAPPEKAAELAA